jgi:hypothetical protein
LRQALFKVRKQRFKEICKSSAEEALLYLQQEMAAVVDHSSETESKAFRELATHLFNWRVFGNSTSQAVPYNPAALHSGGMATSKAETGILID